MEEKDHRGSLRVTHGQFNVGSRKVSTTTGLGVGHGSMPSSLGSNVTGTGGEFEPACWDTMDRNKPTAAQ